MEPDQIIYYLRLLHFLKSEEFSEEQLNSCIDFLTCANLDYQCPTKVYRPVPQIIDVVEDRILKLAVVRNADKVNIHNNKQIEYNKKVYKFDSVFDGLNEREAIIEEMSEFIKKRSNVNKNTSVITYGMSRSGKSSLIANLNSSLDVADAYTLMEVYNNELFVYCKESKIKAIDPDAEKYKFYSDDIMCLLDKFSRKCSNGVNQASSRSHVILTLWYRDHYVRLFDLAGAEKINQKALAEETKYINKSLFNVNRVLLNPKHRDNKDILLNIIKKTSNIVFTTMLTDNNMSKACSILIQFASLFI